MKKTYKKIKVDKNWIESNTLLLSRNRKIYDSGVNKFVSAIRNNEFDTDIEIQLVKDKDTGKYKILDGQHRLEAIRLEDASITLDVIIREDMNDDESTKKCKLINAGKQWRLIDDINSYIGKNEWLDALLKDNFPINISINGGVNSMRIDKFFNVIHNGRVKCMRRRNLSRKTVDQFIETLDQTTYLLMSDFCNFYKRCFGEPTKDNWMYRNIMLFTIFRIWNANRKKFKDEELANCFKRIETVDSIRRDSLSVDSIGVEDITRKIYRIINGKRTHNKFIIFWEEYMNL